MNKRSRLGWMVVVVAMVVAFATPGWAKGQTLRVVSAWPKTVYEVKNFLHFIDMAQANLDKAAPGELTLDYRGGPEVIPNREQVEALRNGLVDMVFTAVGYYTSAIPVVDGLNCSQLTPAGERAAGMNQFLDKIHQEKVNAKFLGRLGTDLPFMLHLNKPIKSADLSGLKIRCSPTHTSFIKALHGTPVVIPPPDVYTSLERGVVDGFVWPGGLIRDWGWNKVTKYIVEPGFYVASGVVLVNLDAWNKLPKKVQDILSATEANAEDWVKHKSDNLLAGELKSFAADGIQIIHLSPAEGAKLQKVAEDSMWDIVLKKDPVNGPKLRKILSR